MIYLILGLILWTVAHLFKRVVPDLRDRMGNAGKGLVAVGVLAGLVLMVVGYRQAEFINVWFPPDWMVHVNNLMMLGAVFLYGMSATRGRLRGAIRHPQLTAIKVWAVAHLLVNGDLASLVLFGGLLSWAVLEVVVINLAEEWQRPEPGEAKKDILLAVITVVMFLAITFIHNWLGVWPFPG
ncbi:NnrU protein [Roseovarius azorensis]|uniref:NnrU protein n=1 Tax=Roseovarius azorensis TaxID=1287727 RepID=A0A1H7UWB6_9RHOB|nr:NnrU family protein [Roseovarius azorensis]SEM01106.1 NnrU protein [Roseovarius azorensis]